MKDIYVKLFRRQGLQGRGPVRQDVRLRAAFVAVQALSMALPISAQAAVVSDLQFPNAMTPGFRWSESIEFKLSGMPVKVRRFIAAHPLEAVAQAMAKHQDKFQRVTTLPGTILLSGVYNQHHWVAQLEAIQDQVQGMVSTLPLQLAPNQESHSSNPMPWLTHDARYVFEHDFGGTSGRVLQSVHLIPGSPRAYIAQLESRLLREGWQQRAQYSWEHRVPGQSRPLQINAYPTRPAGLGAAVLISQAR